MRSRQHTAALSILRRQPPRTLRPPQASSTRGLIEHPFPLLTQARLEGGCVSERDGGGVEGAVARSAT